MDTPNCDCFWWVTIDMLLIWNTKFHLDHSLQWKSFPCVHDRIKVRGSTGRDLDMKESIFDGWCITRLETIVEVVAIDIACIIFFIKVICCSLGVHKWAGVGCWESPGVSQWGLAPVWCCQE